MTTIKTLSLWQPWATLMVIGAKACETRSWSTNYRGPLMIHASKRFAQDERHLCMEPVFTDALRAGGCKTLRDLPLRAIIGRVDLIDVVPTDNITVTSIEDVFGNYGPGRFAWVTENPLRLATPIPWRGLQGLFNVGDDALKGAHFLTPEIRQGRPPQKTLAIGSPTAVPFGGRSAP